MSFDFAFAVQILPALLKAGLTTIAAALGGFIVANLIGLATALVAAGRSAKIAAGIFVVMAAIRSTPLLLHVYAIFLVLPQFGIVIDALTCGVLAIGIHYSAYIFIVYGAALRSVPRGQWEAGMALNLSRFRLYRHIILPQAVRPIIPVLANYMVAIFKETPILSVVAVYEIMQAAKVIAANTFRYIEPYTMVGIYFLVISIIANLAIAGLSKALGLSGAKRVRSRKPDQMVAAAR